MSIYTKRHRRRSQSDGIPSDVFLDFRKVLVQGHALLIEKLGGTALLFEEYGLKNLRRGPVSPANRIAVR
jgi:hypothetical protein